MIPFVVGMPELYDRYAAAFLQLNRTVYGNDDFSNPHDTIEALWHISMKMVENLKEEAGKQWTTSEFLKKIMERAIGPNQTGIIPPYDVSVNQSAQTAQTTMEEKEHEQENNMNNEKDATKNGSEYHPTSPFKFGFARKFQGAQGQGGSAVGVCGGSSNLPQNSISLGGGFAPSPDSQSTEKVEISGGNSCTAGSVILTSTTSNFSTQSPCADVIASMGDRHNRQYSQGIEARLKKEKDTQWRKEKLNCMPEDAVTKFKDISGVDVKSTGDPQPYQYWSTYIKETKKEARMRREQNVLQGELENATTQNSDSKKKSWLPITICPNSQSKEEHLFFTTRGGNTSPITMTTITPSSSSLIRVIDNVDTKPEAEAATRQFIQDEIRSALLGVVKEIANGLSG